MSLDSGSKNSNWTVHCVPLPWDWADNIGSEKNYPNDWQCSQYSRERGLHCGGLKKSLVGISFFKLVFIEDENSLCTLATLRLSVRYEFRIFLRTMNSVSSEMIKTIFITHSSCLVQPQAFVLFWNFLIELRRMLCPTHVCFSIFVACLQHIPSLNWRMSNFIYTIAMSVWTKFFL